MNLFITFYGGGSPRPGIKHSFTLRFVSLSLQWALLSTQIHAQVNTDHKFANWWCLTGGVHTRSQRFTYRAHCRCSRISLMLLAVPTRCLFCYGRRATDGIPIDVFLLLSSFFCCTISVSAAGQLCAAHGRRSPGCAEVRALGSPCLLAKATGANP